MAGDWPAVAIRCACALAAVAGVTLLAGHARNYFFLFDDFALIGQASRWPLHDVVATPLFNFYRPALFLVMGVAHDLFGWQAPPAYAFVVVALHAANAALVAGLVRRLAGGIAASVAGALFLLSPWSAEAFLWISGGFDVLATSASLVALTAGLAASDEDRAAASRAVWSVACVATAVVAAFAKESAVVLPVVFAALLVARPRPWASRWAAGVLMLLVGSTAGYLAVRRQVTHGLAGGAYGDWFALMRGADVVANVGSHLRALVFWIAPHDMQMRATGLMAVARPISAALLVLLAVAAVGLRARLALAVAAAAAACAVPVLWLGLSPLSSGGGRILYFPGVFFAMLIAIGAAALMRSRRSGIPRAVACGVGIALVTAFISLHAQQVVWAKACQLSRDTILAFRVYVGGREPLHVDNLPFWFEEGPYVLKSYAFGYYYHPAPVPPVTATALTLVSTGGRTTVTTRRPEPGVPPTPVEGRHVVLPIEVR